MASLKQRTNALLRFIPTAMPFPSPLPDWFPRPKSSMRRTSPTFMTQPRQPSSGDSSQPDSSHSEPSTAPFAELSLRNLCKGYPGVGPVVEHFDLEVSPGELLSVLGPSGCGKTTLLRLIGGFETPDAGEILHQGQAISTSKWVQPPETRRFGFVFQEYSLFPHLTVRENVQFGLNPSPTQRLRAWFNKNESQSTPKTSTSSPGSAPSGKISADNGEHRSRMRDKRGLVELMTICGLTEMSERYPHELSGGQQQRVALARALAVRPSLVLLDEPFSSLDATLRARLRDEVRAILKKLGTTAILVTHDQEEAINMGDRVAVMSRGALEQVAPPEEILLRPRNRFVAAFVGRNRFLPGHIENGMLRTELGDFPLLPGGASPGGVPPGGVPPGGASPGGAPAASVHAVGSRTMDLVLRPNQIILEPSGRGTSAQVRQVTYLGGQPLYALTLPSGHEVEALFPDSVRPRPGDHISISYRPDPLIYFPRK